jgi:hypothetical protein
MPVITGTSQVMLHATLRKVQIERAMTAFMISLVPP